MKNLTPFILVLLLAACGQDIQLPEGVECPDEVMQDLSDTGIRERADVNSDEYDETYAYGYFIGRGCTAPLPSIDL